MITANKQCCAAFSALHRPPPCVCPPQGCDRSAQFEIFRCFFLLKPNGIIHAFPQPTQPQIEPGRTSCCGLSLCHFLHFHFFYFFTFFSLSLSPLYIVERRRPQWVCRGCRQVSAIRSPGQGHIAYLTPRCTLSTRTPLIRLRRLSEATGQRDTCCLFCGDAPSPPRNRASNGTVMDIRAIAFRRPDHDSYHTNLILTQFERTVRMTPLFHPNNQCQAARFWPRPSLCSPVAR